MTKVQINSYLRPVRRSCTAALLLMMAVAGCGGQEPQEDAPHIEGRFGDGYQILTNVHPDAPDEPPAIDSDSLSVLVAYSGGCQDHDFSLQHETARDTTRLWLRHNNGGDDCEAMIYDRLLFELPGDVLESPTILLLNPSSEAEFIVRWNAAAKGRGP